LFAKRKALWAKMGLFNAATALGQQLENGLPGRIGCINSFFSIRQVEKRQFFLQKGILWLNLIVLRRAKTPG